jgi:hypothetical protein
MFKRKKMEPSEPVLGTRPTASGPDVAPLPGALLPDEAAPERTTCYPQDSDALPAVLGQPRTTVYRQSASWNRGGYDTVN